MSSSDDDLFEESDNDKRGSNKTKSPKRRSTSRGGKSVSYVESSSSQEDESDDEVKITPSSSRSKQKTKPRKSIDDNDESDDDFDEEVQFIEKKPPPRKTSNANKKQVKKSIWSQDNVALSQSSGCNYDEVEIVSAAVATAAKASKKKTSPKKGTKKSMLESLDEAQPTKGSTELTSNDGDLKPAAAAASITAAANTTNPSEKEHTNNGINVLIPHALLNKHQNKGDCTMLVQVDNGGDDTTNHQLDFIGQSGAVGRFEADGEGVTLDLKGFQYRGTIRPGPTAMVIALTRDNQFKVEAITDEFVTLDAERTNMMDKFDAVIEGEMDEGYRVTDDNVNRNERKTKSQEEDGKKEGGGKRKGDKKAVSGGAVKKRKVAASKK